MSPLAVAIPAPAAGNEIGAPDASSKASNSLLGSANSDSAQPDSAQETAPAFGTEAGMNFALPTDAEAPSGDRSLSLFDFALPTPKPALGGSQGSAGSSEDQGTVRVLRGDWHGQHRNGPAAKSAMRDTTEHVTVTVMLYRPIAGGVLSADDVRAAETDMVGMYAAC